jgi:hypothetical protein
MDTQYKYKEYNLQLQTVTLFTQIAKSILQNVLCQEYHVNKTENPFSH